MCPLRQITCEVASEIFHFFWLDACAIVEQEETKLKRLSELKTSLRKQKYPIALIENSIKRALQVPLNELRKSKEKGRDSMRQAPNLERLLCKSKLMPVEEHFHVNSCGKNCVCSPYLLKASSYLFKRVNKVFF